MNLFPLALFPQGSLAESVITTVWLGALVVIFFHNRLGWSLSGIIVPGYLVPLLILKPWSVAVILVEAVGTYLLCRLLFIAPARLGVAGSVFGRDRFFALILCGVTMRLLMELWLLPMAAHFVAQRYGLPQLGNENLHGFGLIILALMANQLWKPGLVCGLGALAITLAVTWLLAVGLLIPFTNFTISNVAYLYEDLAGSIDATPKAYMILICAAWLASRMNMNYGWEYNGILVPALLALLWSKPWEVVITVAEALIIFVLARATLKLPGFRGLTLEGGHKLLFFFTLGFVYKIVLGHGLLLFAPDIRVTAYFGFGYMLSTLMAVKMHQKSISIQLTRAALQVSLTAAVAANLIGFALLRAMPNPRVAVEAMETPREINTRSSLNALRTLKPTVRQASDRGVVPSPDLQQLLARACAQPKSVPTRAWQRIGYRRLVLEERFEVLIPENERDGVFLIDPQSTTGLALLVPNPAEERFSVEAAWSLCEALEPRLMVLGQGTVPSALQAIRLVGGKDNRLSASGRLPKHLDLDALLTRVPDLALSWSEKSRDDALALTLDAATRRALSLKAQASDRRDRTTRLVVREGLPDAHWMRLASRVMAPEDSRYRPLRRQQLLFVNREVLEPLLRLSKTGRHPDLSDDLSMIAGNASVVGYRVYHYRNPHQDYLVLAERDGARARGLGSYLFRLGGGAPFQVQVPRPQQEGGTAGFGLAAFHLLEAQALLMPGAVGVVDDAATDDPSVRRDSLFHLVYQAHLRAAGATPTTVLQIRGEQKLAAEGFDAVLTAAGRHKETANHRRKIDALLEGQHLRGVWAEGLAVTAAYNGLISHQARYLGQSQEKYIVTLRLDGAARRAYRPGKENAFQTARYAALGIETKTVDLAVALMGERPGFASPGLVAEVRAYLDHRDIGIIHNLLPRYELVRWFDTVRGQGFLLVFDRQGHLLVAANLDVDSRRASLTLAPYQTSHTALNQRAAIWHWRTP